MRKRTLISSFSALLLCTCILLNSCKKDSEADSNIIVKLKDAPSDYDIVNIEVISVEINNNGGWITIPVQDSIYDLLLLQGNATSALGASALPAGHITQVRLLLGSHNTVKVSGVIFPLALSSQDETGLKLNVDQHLIGGVVHTLVIDFDAEKSIVKEGNGTYRLKPVLSASFI